MVFRNLAGIIWSVSILFTGITTAVEVSVINFSLEPATALFTNSLGSVMTPLMPAAATASGPARIVRAPVP